MKTLRPASVAILAQAVLALVKLRFLAALALSVPPPGEQTTAHPNAGCDHSRSQFGSMSDQDDEVESPAAAVAPLAAAAAAASEPRVGADP